MSLISVTRKPEEGREVHLFRASEGHRGTDRVGQCWGERERERVGEREWSYRSCRRGLIFVYF